MNNTPTRLIAAKRLAVAVAAVCATLAAPAFATDDVKNVLDLMLKKGVITQQDYDQFMKDNADAAENKQFKDKRLDQDVGKANAYILKNAEAGQVMKNGLGFQSADGANTVQLTGRVHWDSRQYAQGPYQDRMEVRRARIGVKGQLAKDFKYEIVTDLGISNSTSTIADAGMSNQLTGTDVAYIDYAGIKDVSFRVGRFKMPFSLEQLTSSNNIDTIERSLMGQLEGENVPAKETGAMVFGSPVSGVTYALATSRGRGNADATTATTDYIGRVTGNLAQLAGRSDMIAHLGLGYSKGEAKASYAIVSGRTEAREEDKFFTGSSTSGISTRTRQGVEFALAYDAFKLQGETFDISYDDTATTDKQVKGHYIQAVWNMTGEQHNYSNSSGTFGGLKVKSPFTMNGGTGAWQLVIRQSELDGSNAGTITSGKTSGAKAMTLGLNWVMNENARMMLNYIKTDFNSAVTNAGQSLLSSDAIVLRGQLAF
ncbi:OprP Phosphate-selective porin [Oxalobacteraceae bacterium]